MLIAAAFPQVLLGLETFVVRDYGFFAYPLAHYQRECFWRGELPLWNPYNNCGVPFLAQWNTMPLYPPALIYLLLPLSWSLSFFCLAHLFWAGLGMYFLARRWTDNSLGAAVAGVIFAFNGFTLNLLMWPSHIATLSWMPWVLLTVEKAWRDGGRAFFVAAIVGALQMLGGGPETIFFTWLICLAIWVIEIWRGRSEPGLQLGAILYRFPLLAVLVAGLAAAQILPFLDLATHSQREQGYADTRWSMPGWGWANFLVPMVFGRRWSKGLFFQYEQAWTSSYYLGVGALLLALLAVWSMRLWRVRFLAAASILALLLALGDQFFLVRWLRQVIPQLSLMTYPVKYLTVVTLAVPLLAAFGINELQTSRARGGGNARIFFPSGILLALIAGILFWAWRFPFPTDDVSAALANGLSRVVFLVLFAVLLWFMHRSDAWQRSGPTRVFFSTALLLISWLDVWTHEPSQNPTVPVFVYTPNLARTNPPVMVPQPALGQSRAMLTPAADTRFRQFLLSDFKDNFLVKRLGYFANCNLLDDVPKVDGFFSICPRQSGELLSALYGSTNASYPHLNDFLAVSQITATGEFFKWEPRRTFLPVVTAGQQPVFLDDSNALPALLNSDFDGRKYAVIPPSLKPLVTVTHRTRAQVTPAAQAKIKSQKMIPDLDVTADEPSLVVLSQTYYHCWRAYLDGQPTPLLRANYAFQAVQVPAGKHHLHLAYEDRGFQIGVAGSIGCLLACVAGWFASGRKPALGGNNLISTTENAARQTRN